MPSPRLLPSFKDRPTDSHSLQEFTEAISPQLRSEIRIFAILVLIVIITSFLFQVGDLLDLALANQQYGVDEIIVIVVILSIVLTIFLIRRWRDLRQAMSTRALALQELKGSAHINGQLSKMTSLLHACFTLDEANKIISHFAQQLFPDQTGELYAFRSSRNLLELSAIWGEVEGHDSMFAPQDCWALRQGQVYEVSDPQQSVLCMHVKHANPYLCLPMMAHGEVLALLHVCLDPDTDGTKALSETRRSLLKVFTEQIALALSNLKLRDSLRQQSIRDPLTGLFNRRYLEESLLLEIQRAKRSNSPFSILMIDLDHFKRFNDTHGHEAGDIVLQTLGRFLQRHIRGGDIACRYGGEEFTLVLPGTTLELAQQRAEELCAGIRSLHVEFNGSSLGPLSFSVGIATFPNHGDGVELVLQAADMALYQAKNEGRDRVVVAV
jgi:diguanylate cyclase (GGDEF)-like protein